VHARQTSAIWELSKSLKRIFELCGNLAFFDTPARNFIVGRFSYDRHHNSPLEQDQGLYHTTMGIQHSAFSVSCLGISLLGSASSLLTADS
jgi:hypothetical protein